MTDFRLLSALLQYPEERVLAARDELRSASDDPRVGAFLDGLGRVPLGDLQREYVTTFDFDRRASLYLTYHTHGDRRQRGLELVRLKRRFAAAGLELADDELPDYLPALLEFASLAPEGREPLAELRPSLELVRGRLHQRESRYAPLFDALVEALPPLTRAQEERARRLAEEGPPSELVGLDPVVTVPEEVAQ
ncbi:MAG TPA: nitrate reductase molybdenum cofactor assembly chaperone [Gaiellaceae bacterium]|nr:nitrate reductase molybdenum cofactor assembly chaperone [Gaiellaceae bacterium]